MEEKTKDRQNSRMFSECKKESPELIFNSSEVGEDVDLHFTSVKGLT